MSLGPCGEEVNVLPATIVSVSTSEEDPDMLGQATARNAGVAGNGAGGQRRRVVICEAAAGAFRLCCRTGCSWTVPPNPRYTPRRHLRRPYCR